MATPDTTERRRSTDATWFRVLERFGLPTLFALVLLGSTLARERADRSERVELLAKLTAAIEEQTKAFRELRDAEYAHADAVRSDFRLRGPTLHAAPHKRAERTAQE